MLCLNARNGGKDLSSHTVTDGFGLNQGRHPFDYFIAVSFSEDYERYPT